MTLFYIIFIDFTYEGFRQPSIYSSTQNLVTVQIMVHRS